MFSKQILRPRARSTDVISEGGSIGGMGLFLSDNLKSILSKYNLAPHRYYEQELVKDGDLVQEKYYWMQILVIDGLIDFKKSDFFLTKSLGRFIKNLEINSLAEFDLELKKIDDLEYIDFRRVVLNEKYKKLNLDIFYFLNMYSSYKLIISERLKQKLEEQKITGLKPFKKLNIDLE